MHKETKRILLQIALFIATFISTTIAGNEWAYGRNIFSTPDYGWHDFVNGLSFSIPLLLVLTMHEFGHYFVAMYHKVKTSLPYYIPIPPIPGLPFRLALVFIQFPIVIIAAFFFASFFFVDECGIVENFNAKRLWLKRNKEVNLIR